MLAPSQATIADPRQPPAATSYRMPRGPRVAPPERQGASIKIL